MFAPHIGDVAEKMTTLAGSAAKPDGAGRRCADPGEASEARRVPVLHRAQPGHLTRYGVPTTRLAGLARLPSGPA
jgi:hypothetical protein